MRLMSRGRSQMLHATGGILMNVVERLARRADRAQQGVRPLAFAVGVFKKFGDDRGGSLAALLTFYGFLSLFPLLLLLVTILGFFGGSEHSFVQRVENSAFSQFPVVGTKLSTQHPRPAGPQRLRAWSWGSSSCSGAPKARCRRRSTRRRRSGTSPA